MAGGEEHIEEIYRFEIDCEAGAILILEIAIRFVDGRQEEVPVPEYNVKYFEPDDEGIASHICKIQIPLR